MAQAAEAVLQAAPGTATAIPFQPGLGKSTLIRALLEVLSCEFQQNTSIAQKIGGVIVVVEKTAEAEELEMLCNSPKDRTPVAKAISAPNDFNLAQGRCLNGTATSYLDCAGHSCPDCADCELMQSAHQIHHTPILIMLHARYLRYMEGMSQFMMWEDDNGEHSRTLLLVDELPSMIEENALSLDVLNKIESDLSQYKPSYQVLFRREKKTVLYEWNATIRRPFLKLYNIICKSSEMYGLVSRKELEEAGFTLDKLSNLLILLTDYLGSTDHPVIQLIHVLTQIECAYYAVGQDLSLFMPRLRKINREGQPATFLFSGTAVLSPELSGNPDILSFPDKNLESFQRLTVNIQRGDLFNASKTGLAKRQNLFSIIAWLQYILPQMASNHKRILVVTYKAYAKMLWAALAYFHNILIPYIGSNGKPEPQLPYFGGMNGSNLYRESTCVICVGVNRFEPREYISRTLALDFDGTYRGKINEAIEVGEGQTRIDSLPCIMDMQDITLARDLVQMVFRSALRNHGESQPIELWLLQPPNGVIQHLKDYFGDCSIQEYTELPESCQIAATVSKEYLGKQTHAGKLLSYLDSLADGETFTPTQIRDATGLTQGQFKEARKNKSVQIYFDKHFQVTGSGKNTVYTKIHSG